MAKSKWNFAVIAERGAMFGPFDSIIEAQLWADENLGESHGYKLMKLISPDRPNAK